MVLYSSQLKLNACLVGTIANSVVDLGWGEAPPSIHSIFKRVVNISTTSGLISVVNRSIGKSASYIIIDQDINFLESNIKPLDIIERKDNTLILGNLILDTSRAGIWKDIINSDFYFKRLRIDFENIRVFKASMDRYASEKSFWKRFHYDRDISERIKKLMGNKPYEGVRGLIGLGPGLTPSGDDVLLGFLSIVNTCDSFDSEREVFNKEILCSLKYTSDISAYFLKMAVQNHYHEYVQNVICSMVQGPPECVAIGVRRLLSIGATSGADIALGMYLAFSI